MYVRIEKEGPITTVIMDRKEKRNAVDRFMAEELREAFMEFEADGDQHVAVLWGDNGVFCAGADLSSLNDPDRVLKIEADGSGHGPMGPSRMQFSKPLIAATPGYSVAGGLELALLADMRVAEESSIFGVYCRRWGVPLIDGGTIRLPRTVGMGRAMDMILTGRPVSAKEALQFGLVNRIVPDGQSRTEAEKIAHEISKFPQVCMRADRLSAYEQWNLPLQEALYREGSAAQSIMEQEGKSGAARFVDGAGRHGKF
ncbi:MAG: crotonase/enoyl-CoA hydratase family protein [Rhizobiales bacterium TMED83]|jgi:enoyl-CoA hydratase|nr:enoyl-CoA hydratase [Rhodobiaceae bacterium]RPF93243.1 MAG: crotonase/enoyl-CoA hydratase family protein [Rhizobiales bacterium TMED83]|tara:strand:+ start:707 stop:1474 length:768 start_codon:yes stop_codon:yes gene_type:complete